MHRYLMPFAAIASLMLLVIITTARAQEQSEPASDKPEVIALKFHADWCATCRRMGTIFEDLAVVAEEEPVMFAELDLTDRRTRQQAEYLMSLLDLDQVWNQAGSGTKTGFILLVDAENRQPVGQLSADQDLKQMKAAVLAAVSQSSQPTGGR